MSSQSQVLLEGPAYLVGRDGQVPKRLARGSVLVIDVADVDRAFASYLLGFEPAAVLNAGSSFTGRKPTFGAQVIIDAGVPLIDDCGPDLLEVREDDIVTVRGPEVYRQDTLVAAGKVLGREDVRLQGEAGLARSATALTAYAVASAGLFTAEEPLITQGLGIPNLQGLFKNKAAVLVAGALDSQDEKAVRSLLSTRNAVLVAVGAQGFHACQSLRRHPTLVIGDPGGAATKAALTSSELVLLERPDGRAAGEILISGLDLPHHRLRTGLSELDAALLTAYHCGTTAIVMAGTKTDVASLLDAGGDALNGHLLILGEVEELLVGLSAWRSLQVPTVPAWLLLLLLVASIVAVVAAVLLTPWGSQFMPPFSSSSTLFSALLNGA